MPPCRVPVFPMEIFEAIIDQASDNTAALRHLSLICHAFLPRARYQLFSSVVLQTLQRVESFTAFLDTHPWVRPLVQILTHSIYLRVSVNSTVDMLDNVPMHLLPKLPNLHTWRVGIPEDEGGDPGAVWLQLGPSHRSALSAFPPSHSSQVRNLELESVYFKDKSAFTWLVSAFTGIQTLTCSDVVIKSSRETGEGPISPPQLRTLTVSMSVDIKGLEYLLNSSRNTLKEFVLTLNHLRPTSYFETLQTLVGSLSRLRSFTLTTPSGPTHWREDDSEDDLLSRIGHAASLIRSIKSIHGRQVRVEFQPGPIASLAACLASGARVTETCKAFEDALLIFPHSYVRFHDYGTIRRAGRLEFWSGIIKKAFPRLSEGGRLILPEPKSDAADLIGHEATVNCLAVSYGQRVVSGSNDGTIIVWDAERGIVLQEWYAHRDGIKHLALSPDGRRLVSLGRWEGTTPTVWDTSNNIHQIARLEGHTEVVIACAWSPDGMLIASTSMDGTVRIWDAQTFRQRELLKDPGLTLGYKFIRFSPNSRYLGACMPLMITPFDWHGCATWKLFTGEQSKRFSPSQADIGGNVWIKVLSFDAESRYMATAHGENNDSSENVIRVWDVTTGAALAELPGHTGGISTDLSFSLDGRYLLFTSCDGFTITQWNAKWDRRHTAFPADGRSGLGVIGASFSPDGKYVATRTWGDTVQLWRTDYGSCAAVFTEHRTRVMHVAFSSDSEWLASGDLEGVVHIRRLSHWMEN